MKTAAYTRYGPPDVVQIMDVEKPVPKDNEVLIKVRAASVNPADWRLMGGAPYVFRVLFRMRKPTPAEPGRLGHDVAGHVEVVGRNVTRFKPADSVFGMSASIRSCGLRGAEAWKIRSRRVQTKLRLIICFLPRTMPLAR